LYVLPQLTYIRLTVCFIIRFSASLPPQLRIRSDYPNQINNVCAFPYIFRGALDCRATCINEEMKIACTNAIAELARTKDGWLEDDSECPDFGRDYILPKPFDKRLLLAVAPAVAQAAADSGCARQPLDKAEYVARLQHQVF
jgi:malate dehydrogenase (oxaloacetate-decarboxylating)(NADP+)